MPTTTHQTELEAALIAATASRAPKVEAPRPTYAEARAELDARQRQGEWVKRKNSAGQFIAPVQVATYGGAASALKMAAE